MRRLVLFGILMLFGYLGPLPQAIAAGCSDHALNQTSANLMFEYSTCTSKSSSGEAAKKHLLITDIYIKARSYAIINKIFFWGSVAAAVMVLLWPSISIIFREKIENRESLQWLRSPVLQTTITGIAALMFAFYSQYKDKQTSAETLMRNVFYSIEKTDVLAPKVADELARIDRGFDFKSTFGDDPDN